MGDSAGVFEGLAVGVVVGGSVVAASTVGELVGKRVGDCVGDRFGAGEMVSCESSEVPFGPSSPVGWRMERVRTVNESKERSCSFFFTTLAFAILVSFVFGIILVSLTF